MAEGRRRFNRAMEQFSASKQGRRVEIPGLLGAIINGVQTVFVADREGYVYVRPLDNTSEQVQAFNGGRAAVSPVYDLPVRIARDEVDPTRWTVVGIDVARYREWGSTSYQARHGAQHSFLPESPGDRDIVWVYGRQIMPGNTYPLTTDGSTGVYFSDFPYWYNGAWHYFGATDSDDLTQHNPTGGSSARLVLLGIAAEAGTATGVLSSEFAESTTGNAAIVGELPDLPDGMIPLSAVRLVTGTTQIGWRNIYDLRAHIGWIK